MAAHSVSSLLPLMDLLDVDEQTVDKRLESLMSRSTFTKEHLQRIGLLLQYKLLLNSYDDSDLDNRSEVIFAIQLLTRQDENTVDETCDIVYTVLLLNKQSLETNAQHILQQIVCDIDLQSIATINNVDKNNLLFVLKVVDKVLQAAAVSRIKIFLLFNHTALENVLYCDDAVIRNHFLTKTVVHLVEAVEGMNILDRIWNSISFCDNSYKKKALIALTSLSDYYLPAVQVDGTAKYKSTVIRKKQFWINILEGLKCEDTFIRRCSLYLAKRAVDCAVRDKNNIDIKSADIGEPLFTWEADQSVALEASWRSFFILIETLEEKQGNIVTAGLFLFNEISLLCRCWRNCAFDLALKHQNLTVLQKSIEYKIKDGLCSIPDAQQLLAALNNINMCDHSLESRVIMKAFSKLCTNSSQLKLILSAFPQISWLPVPLFRLTEIISTSKFDNSFCEEQNLVEIFKRMICIPCNNIVISDAVQYNVLCFIVKSRCISIQRFVELIVECDIDCSKQTHTSEDLIIWIEESLKCNENDPLWNFITSNSSSVSLIVEYLKHNDTRSDQYVSTVRERIKLINDINGRPYSNKAQYEEDFVYICRIVRKLRDSSGKIPENLLYILDIVEENIESLVSYMIDALDNELRIDQLNKYIEICPELLKNFAPDRFNRKFMNYPGHNLMDEDLKKILNAINCQTISSQTSYLVLVASKISAMIEGIQKRCETQNQSKLGKLRNKLNEVSCEIIFNILLHKIDDIPVEILSEFLYKIINTSDQKCLLWTLKIYKLMVHQVCNNAKSQLHPQIFLARTWKEVKDIRSNVLCKPCIKEFVAILLHECLLLPKTNHELINNYTTKILNYAVESNASLYYLVNEMNAIKNVNECEPLISLLSNVLLFGRGTSKDHRITDETVKYIKENPKWLAVRGDHYLDCKIRNLATKILVKNATSAAVAKVTSDVLQRVLAVFHNKTRYHANSQPHRILFRALQHTLLLVVVCPEGMDLDETVSSYVELMGKLPHQPSVRLCVEIFLAYYIIIKGLKLENSTMNSIGLDKLPLSSQFSLIFLVMKHKLKSHEPPSSLEYEFAMNLLFSHTMGQLFNVRLHAQYYALKLHEAALDKHAELSEKYNEIVKIIKHTFDESKTEKSLIKLQECYFVNEFNFVDNLTPECIYNVLPRLTQMEGDEIVERKNIITIDECKTFIKDNGPSAMTRLWVNSNIVNPIIKKDTLDVKSVPEVETVDFSTIQKKYIPWSHMFHGEEACIVNTKKNEKASGLIVVASLIDKLPNLGGLARTNEVFGIKKYVIDNLKHLEDKNFQGLSVSAEKWVEIEQVRPGAELKEFLKKSKSEGYCIVAAEQTSNSVPLQGFHFPHNTLLLLGHEKEGVPCDLLPYMDHCVEIPQRGCIRSLNVHVTAAIFVWEYVRQNLL